MGRLKIIKRLTIIEIEISRLHILRLTVLLHAASFSRKAYLLGAVRVRKRHA